LSGPAGLLAEVLDSVIRQCGEREPDAMAEARQDMDRRRGPVFEDEHLWETRTRAFLEWFAIERRAGELTPIERALASASPSDSSSSSLSSDAESPRVAAALLAWHRSYRILAEVAELSDGQVLLIDLLGGATIPVDERRGLPGVSTGDIAECRVVAFEGEIHFGGWSLGHPEGTRGPLLEHIAVMGEAGREREEILDFAASLRVRSLRYSHVPAPRVYGQVSSTEGAEPAASAASVLE